MFLGNLFSCFSFECNVFVIFVFFSLWKSANWEQRTKRRILEYCVLLEKKRQQQQQQTNIKKNGKRKHFTFFNDLYFVCAANEWNGKPLGWVFFF